MRTAYISHPDCHGHDTGPHHPERAQRLGAIEDALIAGQLMDLLYHLEAPEVSREQLLRVHDAAYLTRIEAAVPTAGHAWLDPDTVIGPGSLRAAQHAAGAAVLAVDQVLAGRLDNAFCAVRPPGHHAERARAMGFCLYNNVAVGAAHALAAHGLERVAILDFDVHQGNGTEQIFADNPRVLFCSSFQHPYYPYAPLLPDNDHRVSVPLAAGTGSEGFRAAVSQAWLPALARFRPQLVLVSAGFDAHRDDDMSGISLTDADYAWVTARIVEAAKDTAQGRIVSLLEGGYETASLGRSVMQHLRVLMGLD